MKKFFIAVLFLLPAVFAAAQEAQKMVSYYPTPYAVYDEITANEVAVLGTGPNTPAIKAGSFGITMLDVGADLNVQSADQVSSKFVLVGPNPARSATDAKGRLAAGLLRLNNTLGNGTIRSPFSEGLESELHLIDTWNMHDTSGKTKIFPYARPMNPKAKTMRWKDITYCLDTPCKQNCVDEWKDPANHDAGTEQKCTNITKTATFLVIDETSNCTKTADALAPMKLSYAYCGYWDYFYPDGTLAKQSLYSLPSSGFDSIDTCDGNIQDAYTCKPGQPKTNCWDVQVSSSQKQALSDAQAAARATVYNYSVGVLINNNQSPFERPTLNGDCTEGQNFDCHIGKDNPAASVDPLKAGRGWDQFASTYATSAAARLKCQRWSLEFYVGGKLNVRGEEYKIVNGNKVKSADAKQVGWDGGKILATMFLGNWPSLSNKNFSKIGSIGYCQKGVDMSKLCKTAGYEKYKCISAITLPAATVPKAWSSVDVGGGKTADGYSCQDQAGTGVLSSCEDLNPAAPPPQLECKTTWVDCPESPTCSHYSTYCTGGGGGGYSVPLTYYARRVTCC
ncbi:MAG: hypothetical protein LBI01_01045 [Elusimicrobium sp.]|jgi:hypothetical protein|nr:hypothetical protein [Elusimicrobium sp.]